MATDAEWATYTDVMMGGGPSGNAQHARVCRATPLDAKSILDLVMENIGYFGDSYYEPLTAPVEMRVAEFYATLGQDVPS